MSALRAPRARARSARVKNRVRTPNFGCFGQFSDQNATSSSHVGTFLCNFQRGMNILRSNRQAKMWQWAPPGWLKAWICENRKNRRHFRASPNESRTFICFFQKSLRCRKNVHFFFKRAATRHDVLCKITSRAREKPPSPNYPWRQVLSTPRCASPCRTPTVYGSDHLQPFKHAPHQ